MRPATRSDAKNVNRGQNALMRFAEAIHSPTVDVLGVMLDTGDSKPIVFLSRN